MGRGRSLALTGTLLLLMPGLVACGAGDDSSPDAPDAPTNASVKDFCAVVTGAGSDVHGTLRRLIAIGTPPDTDPASRQGFETLVTELDKIPSGATVDPNTLGQAEQRQVMTFFVYAAQKCVKGRDIFSSSP